MGQHADHELMTDYGGCCEGLLGHGPVVECGLQDQAMRPGGWILHSTCTAHFKLRLLVVNTCKQCRCAKVGLRVIPGTACIHMVGNAASHLATCCRLSLCDLLQSIPVGVVEAMVPRYVNLEESQCACKPRLVRRWRVA